MPAGCPARRGPVAASGAGRFGRSCPAEVLPERICCTNGIRQLPAKPHAPATTGPGCCRARMHHDRATCFSMIAVDHLCRPETAGGCRGSPRAASAAVLGAVRNGWDTGWKASLPARATDDRRRLWFAAQRVLARAGRGRCRARAAARRSRKVSMPGLKDRLTDAGYGLGWSVVCRLPESWAQSAFRFFADLAWRRQGPGVQVLEGNLRRVIGSQAPGGQLRGLSRQAMRSYARYWLEAFRLPVMPTGRLAAGMHDTGH